MNNDRPSRNLMRVWTVLFVSVLAIVLLLVFLTQPDRGPRQVMTFVEDPAQGSLTVMDGTKPVLTYRYGDQLPAGLDAMQVRSCYIHPLYALDGDVLTADFPADHLHHHGLFWTWPSVTVRGAATQTWHPAEPSLRQHFVRWIKREANTAGAVLVVRNTWRLGESEDVVEETVGLTVRPISGEGRAIDLEVVLRPVGGSLELRGAAEESKGYGGLCIRGAPLFKGAALTTDGGPLTEDSTGRPFLWADMSTSDLGVAIFVSRDHSDHPLTWLVRNSYAGVLNPCWPGLDGTTISPESSVTLRYRIYIHRGDAMAGRVKEAYEAY